MKRTASHSLSRRTVGYNEKCQFDVAQRRFENSAPVPPFSFSLSPFLSIIFSTYIFVVHIYIYKASPPIAIETAYRERGEKIIQKSAAAALCGEAKYHDVD